MVLLAGYPFWWALGASPFVPMFLAAVMGVLMWRRGWTRLVPGILPWFAFLAWVAAASISVESAGSLLAYGQRAGNLLAVGVFMLYVVNAQKTLPLRRILFGLLAVWFTIVILGVAAIYLPTVRLNTPVGSLLPASLTENELVYNLVFPPLAEVQQPWGSPEAFNRPSAPFPYANSWGVMFVVLTPVVFAAVTLARRTRVKVALLAVAGVSVWPALATSNRGMFIGVLASVLYVLIRLGFRGRLGVVVAGIAGIVISGVALAWSGSLQTILDRQLYSDSTGGRLNLYQQTWKATLERPLLGYGSPRMEETIGVSMGTQGYMWMLMFSYGFVGLGLFVYFLINALMKTWHVPTTAGLWLHSVPLATLAIIPFYGFDIMQLTSVLLIVAVLLRHRFQPDPV